MLNRAYSIEKSWVTFTGKKHLWFIKGFLHPFFMCYLSLKSKCSSINLYSLRSFNYFPFIVTSTLLTRFPSQENNYRLYLLDYTLLSPYTSVAWGSFTSEFATLVEVNKNSDFPYSFLLTKLKPYFDITIEEFQSPPAL